MKQELRRAGGKPQEIYWYVYKVKYTVPHSQPTLRKHIFWKISTMEWMGLQILWKMPEAVKGPLPSR